MKYYSLVKRNYLPKHEKTQKNLKHILLTERIQREKASYCRIPIYMTFWKRQHYGDSKKTSGYKRLAGGGMNREGTKDF